MSNAYDFAKSDVDPSASSGSSSGLSAGQWGTLGLGALGLGGLGLMMSGGPTQVSSIPGYAGANAQVPVLEGQSALTFGQGQGFIGQGAANLERASKGELTPEQAAQLGLDKTGLENQAAQTYASMGRSGADTSKISTQANIDQQITAEAQSYIQSTIALAGQQITAGQNLIGDSLNESNAATNILLQEGQAQIQLNKQYSDSLTSAFKAVGVIFGGVAGAMFGGPAGAVAGATIGSKI